ncbi:MAG: ATP-binding protein [Gammaproteobacteria bacterium]|nr:ATP-binding protein [Gammaproteobacteria bacterium]
MALKLQQGGQFEPIRMMLYGQNGIGKTTFGAGMPKPFILAVEDGIGVMPVTYHRASHEPYSEILSDLMEVGGYFQRGEFQSLIIDSVDALQSKIIEQVLREHNKKTLNDFSYGKGYDLFKQKFEEFRNLMERFRYELNANVLLIAQTEARTIPDPINGMRDIFTMRLDKRAAGVLRDWADFVGFAQLKAFPVMDKDGKLLKMQTDGTRILSTAPSASFDAKNRFDLPPELPLSWVAVENAIKEAFQRPFDPARFAQPQNAWSTAQPPAAPVQPAAPASSGWEAAPAVPPAAPAAPGHAAVPGNAATPGQPTSAAQPSGWPSVGSTGPRPQQPAQPSSWPSARPNGSGGPTM